MFTSIQYSQALKTVFLYFLQIMLTLNWQEMTYIPCTVTGSGYLPNLVHHEESQSTVH